MKTLNKASFWYGEDCEKCGSPLHEKNVELFRKKGKSYFVIQDVPAGVCSSCGMRFFSANVLKLIQQVSSGKNKIKKELEVPVYSLHHS